MPKRLKQLLIFYSHSSILERLVLLTPSFVTRILKKLHESQTHRMNHRSQYIHKHVDRMTYQENQYHHYRTCNCIIRTHSSRQTIEYAGKNPTRQTSSKQTHLRKDIPQQTGCHIVGIPQTQTDIEKNILSWTVEQENQHTGKPQNYQMDSSSHRHGISQ